MGATDSKPVGDPPADTFPSSNVSSPPSLPPSPPPAPPLPSSPPSSFAVHMKSHLLTLIFHAIQYQGEGFVDRTAILDWIHHELYLTSPHLQSTIASLLSQLNHDEDSRISRREFLNAFHCFAPHEITRLCVNLIRDCPLPGQRLRRQLTLLEKQVVRETEGHEERRMVVFMLDMLFHCIDADLDGVISEQELLEFVHQDAFFTSPDSSHTTFQSLHKAREMAHRVPPSSPSTSFPLPIPLHSPVSGITQDDYVAVFSSIPLAFLDRVFIHLLSRSTSCTLQQVGSASRHAHKPVKHREMMDRVMSKLPAHDEPPCQLVAGSKAKRAAHPSFVALPSLPPPGLTLTLLGQSMIQHDLHQTPYGQHILHTLPSLLSADLTFSELETSILPHAPAKATRATVFFHSADSTVIDCLKEMGVNILALANNHAGDMGTEGMQAILEAVGQRGLVGAGLGRNLEEASAPAYMTIKSKHNGQDVTSSAVSSPSPSTSASSSSSPASSTFPCPPSITIALVAHASKVPPGSEATSTSPGVNSLSMSNLDTYTLNESDVHRILSSVSEARKHASIVIAYQHNHYWQGNGAVNVEHVMGNWKREWAHALIDSGATIYVSHGDPRLQGIEIYNGCPLFFCLGSFIFQTKTEIGFYGPEVWQSCIVSVEYHTASPALPHSQRRGKDRELNPQRCKAEKTAPAPSPTFSIKLIPVTLNEVGVPAEPEEVHLATRGLPKVATGEEGKAIMRHVEELSRDFGTRVEIEEGEDGMVVGWVTGGQAEVKGVTTTSGETALKDARIEKVDMTEKIMQTFAAENHSPPTSQNV